MPPTAAPGPYRVCPDRPHVVLDKDGNVIAVCSAAAPGSLATAALLATAWESEQLLEDCHGQALLNTINVQQYAVAGEQSEADARAAERFADRIGQHLARCKGRA